MAEVFRAHDVRHDRPIAIKVLRPYMRDAVDQTRFLREIGVLARLQHPNILPLYDSGGEGDHIYFVMPFVSGGSLRAVLEARRRLPWDEVAEIVRAVGGALRFAHEQGVVHRDVKPENILFSAGVPVLADFGIAVDSRPADPRITSEGFSLGTPEYMSPEQAFGEAHVDARTDVYALAIVCYELITGEVPWHGRQALMRKMLEDAPRLPVHEFPDVPAHVPDALLHALARNADERPASIGEWLRELFGEGTRGSVAVASPTPSVQTIAVLPLSTFSADPQDGMFGDGIAEELIHALARLPGLRVVARTSSFRFRGSDHDIRQIGEVLRVRYLLEGSLRRAGNRLRLTARLIDVSSGFERWSERFDREFTDVFVIQDEIAGAIATSLSVTLAPGGETLVRAATADLTAYEWYIEARHLLAMRTSVALRRAVDLLQRALAQDPSFAKALAALAEVHALLAIYGEEAPAAQLPLAREAAERALAIDAQLAVPHAVLSLVAGVLDGNWDRAESHCREALARGDGAGTAAHWYAMYVLLPQGRFAEAHTQLQRARQLDPASAALAMSVAVALGAARSTALAEIALREFLVREPDYGMAHYFLARAIAAAGRTDEAIAQLVRAGELLPGSLEVLALRGVLDAMAGREGAARDVLRQLQQQSATRYVSPVMLAELHAALGEQAAAIASLVQADAMHSVDLLWLGQRPLFQSLMDDPALGGIVARRRLARRR